MYLVIDGLRPFIAGLRFIKAENNSSDKDSVGLEIKKREYKLRIALAAKILTAFLLGTGAVLVAIVFIIAL